MISHRFVIALLFAANSFGLAMANQYGTTTQRDLQLGDGFNPENLAQIHAFKALKGPKEGIQEEWNSTTAPRHYEVNVELLQKQESLLRRIHGSLGLEARSTFYSGKLAASYDKLVATSSNQLSFVVSAEIDYGRKTIEPVVTAAATNDIRRFRNTPNKFIDKYGKEFITEVTMGARMAAYFTVRSSNSVAIEELKLRLEGSAKGMAVSYKMDASFSSFMQEALSVGKVEFKVLAKGGGGVSIQYGDLKEGVIHSIADVERVKDYVNAYISSMTRERSVPISYGTIPAKTLMETVSDDPSFDIDPLLEESYVMFAEMRSAQSTLQDLISSLRASDPKYSFLDKTLAIKYFSEKLEDTTKKLAVLVTRGKQLMKEGKSNVALPQRVDVEWPNIRIQVFAETWGRGGEGHWPFLAHVRLVPSEAIVDSGPQLSFWISEFNGQAQTPVTYKPARADFESSLSSFVVQHNVGARHLPDRSFKLSVLDMYQNVLADVRVYQNPTGPQMKQVLAQRLGG